MEAIIPLLCMMAFTFMIVAWQRNAANHPVVWTKRKVVAASFAALGAIAVPVLVAAAIWNS